MNKTPLSEQIINEKIAAIFSWQAKPERLYECPRCQKKPVAGTTIYGVNMGTDADKRFIACQDKECTIKGIKEYDPDAQPAKKSGWKSYTPPKRTTEERLADFTNFDKTIVPVLLARAKETAGGALNPEALNYWKDLYLAVWLGEQPKK